MNSNSPKITTTLWGHWEILLETKYCKVKQITVNPGQRLSYQSHQKRQEHWTIVQGTGTLVLNDESHTLCVGENIVIPKQAKHRIGNKTKSPLIFIEVQTGDYFGEDDIKRYEDDYGRC